MENASLANDIHTEQSDKPQDKSEKRREKKTEETHVLLQREQRKRRLETQKIPRGMASIKKIETIFWIKVRSNKHGTE